MLCQPYCGISQAAMKPEAVAPPIHPQVKNTIVKTFALRLGAISLMYVTATGINNPSEIPIAKRRPMNDIRSCAKTAIARLIRPESQMPASSTRRRPIRSLNGPETAEPAAKPASPHDSSTPI